MGGGGEIFAPFGLFVGSRLFVGLFVREVPTKSPTKSKNAREDNTIQYCDEIVIPDPDLG